MRTMPVSNISGVVSRYKSNILKKSNQQFPSAKINTIIKTPASALIIGSLPATLYCGDEEDNIGYGDPSWLRDQRDKAEQERIRRYYGYDTPGLGSGSREMDWDN